MKSQISYFKSMRPWIIAVICLGILAFHIVVYRISVSNNDGLREMVDLVSEVMRIIVPGASSYEYLNRPFHVPYLQLAASILVSIPLSFFLFGRAVSHAMSRKDNSAETIFDIRL